MNSSSNYSLPDQSRIPAKENAEPWSFDKNGKLLFNNRTEHTVAHKKDLTEKEKSLLLTNLNRDLKAGITDSKEIKLGGLLGKKVVVVPPESTKQFGQFALTKAHVGPLEVHTTIALAMSLLSDNCKNADIEKLISIIAKIPPNEREEAVQSLKPFLLSFKTDAEKIEFFSAISSLPKEDRQTFVEVSNLINKTGWGSKPLTVQEKIAFINAVIQLPPDQRENILTTTKPYRSNSDSDNIALFTIVSKIPAHKRNEVLANAKSLQKYLSYTSFQDCITVVLKKPSQDFQRALHDAAPLMKKMTHDAGKIKIFELVFELPTECITVAQPLLDVSTQLNYPDILKLARKLPKETGADTLQKLLPVLQKLDLLQSNFIKEITEKMLALKDLTNLFDDASVAEPNGVIQSILPFLSEVESSFDLRNLIDAASKIVPSQRETIMNAAAPLLKGDIDSDNYRDIIKAVAASPDDARADIVSKTLELINTAKASEANNPGARRNPPIRLTPNPGQYVSTILYIFNQKSTEERANLMESAAPFLGNVPDIRTVVDILRTIDQIRPESREDILASALSLLDEQSSGQYTQTILMHLSRLESRERPALLTQLNPFFAAFPTEENKCELLSFMSRRDSSERPLLLQAALPLLTQNMYFGAFIRRLEDLEETIDTGYANREDKILLAREDLTDNPIAVLNTVIETLRHAPTKELSIEFIGEPGIDAGGLGREVVASVAEGVRQKLNYTKLDNGLFQPEQLNPEDKKVYNQLGELMAFCFTASREYPMGMILNQSVFTIFSKLQPHHFDTSIDDLLATEKGFTELLDMYTSIYATDKTQSQYMQNLKDYGQPFTQETDSKLLQDAYSFASCEFDEERGLDAVANDLSKLKEHLPALQASVREFIIDERLSKLKTILPPVIELARGIKDAPQIGATTWQTLQSLSPEAASEKIQGKISKELIVAKLTFSDDISAVKRGWFNEWINSRDLDTLKKFTFAMTGAYSVGSLPLKILSSPQNSNKFFFHTCFNRLDIPFHLITTKEDFMSQMDALVATEARNDRG